MSREKDRITDENITDLKDGEVFVYGSNESGINGAGAAKLAQKKFGARDGQGYGPMGNSFGIPTKGWGLEPLPLNVIECYIGRFIGYTIQHQEKKFKVTQIGCGLAGFTPEQIAPMFAGVDVLPNISLPQCFWDVIDGVYKEKIVESMLIDNDGRKNELSDV